MSDIPGAVPSLLLDQLLANAPHLSKPWLHAAFVTLLVGYGTKMGLAPLHTWKPDAYGEAPGLAGALLAGIGTSCAFMAIIRAVMVMHAAGEFGMAAGFLQGFGYLSIGLAALFLVRQKDVKRMLAYSSVEHMGILALGLGTGGMGTFAALFHVVNNALAKGVMFLSAGNIHRAFGSKSSERVQGALRVLPWSAALFIIGFFAVTGSPPFAPFVSEFALLQAIFAAGSYAPAIALLLLLFTAFLGMGRTVLAVTQGRPADSFERNGFRESAGTVLPIMFLGLVLLLLGVHAPEAFRAQLEMAAKYVELKP